ncbi:hypothetical protein DFR70_12744 [Nocardia tenerifensis]|uniref:Uncharacterized protein n=1 Tax=Nocardia tenerifensis TaxID=228006 RepID=A0A318JKV2_9NOCA|nr:hypothetical protein [Nocardia tenerifensis]PXX53433.1 hypothetical protein DFR70_12744 [Nocardia tenerifensis]
MIAVLATVALLLLIGWWAFPTLARITGFILTIFSLMQIAQHSETVLPGQLRWLGLGFALWLAGHWMWAFKNGCWASRIALRIFALPGLRFLIPRSTLVDTGGADSSG